MSDRSPGVSPIVAPIPNARKSRFRWSISSVLSPLILTPSMAMIIIFVYVFIGITIWVSLSNWHTLKIDMSIRQPVGITYADMFSIPRWHASLRNMVIFTTLFLAISLSAGLVLALLLERKLLGHNLLRNIFLLPYALSFILTGIAWRWIFTPTTGINLLIEGLGINKLIVALGGPPLKPGWITDPTVLFSLNDWLARIFPVLHNFGVRLGIPVALIPVVIAASWQLTGFSMAMFTAGLATIPNDLREAARVDGASELQVYTKVVIPLLTPVTVGTSIILGHIALKIFDLVYAMTGVGPGFATDVPGIFVFDETFKAIRYNLGAAASIVMLLLVSVIIIPYLWKNLRH